MIASLVTVTGLYSVSWTIIGRPTLFLQPEWILWSDGIGLLHIFLFAIAAAITIILLSRTLFGLRMRAVGENPLMGSALNIGIWRYTVLGLALSNALAALAGALFAQRIYIADINSGFGITLTALVPLLAAGAIVSSSRALATITALIAVFSVAYRMVFGVVLVLEVDPEMYRLVSAVGLALVFVLIRGRTPVIGAGIRWS